MPGGFYFAHYPITPSGIVSPASQSPALIRGILLPKFHTLGKNQIFNTFPRTVFYGGPTVMDAATAMKPFLIPWAWSHNRELALESVPITPNGLGGLRWPHTDFRWWWVQEHAPEPRYKLTMKDAATGQWVAQAPTETHGAWVAGLPEITQELNRFPGFAKHCEKFKLAFLDLCEDLGINPLDLATVMAIESGFIANKRNIINGKTVAMGLIQFIPHTAKIVGVTYEQLETMSPTEQLEYVKKYYKPYYKRLTDVGRVYMATFYPKALYWKDDAIIAKKGEKVYDWNKGLDFNADGVLTAGDVRGFIRARKARYLGRKPQPVPTESDSCRTGATNVLLLLTLAGAGAGFWWYSRRS